jgi:hypothetical protein
VDAWKQVPTRGSFLKSGGGGPTSTLKKYFLLVMALSRRENLAADLGSNRSVGNFHLTVSYSSSSWPDQNSALPDCDVLPQHHGNVERDNEVEQIQQELLLAMNSGNHAGRPQRKRIASKRI